MRRWFSDFLTRLDNRTPTNSILRDTKIHENDVITYFIMTASMTALGIIVLIKLIFIL